MMTSLIAHGRIQPYPPLEVVSVSHGVLDAVDVAALLSVAEQLDGWLEITTPIGSYIGRNTPIGIVRPGRTQRCRRTSMRSLAGSTKVSCSRTSGRYSRTPDLGSASWLTSRSEHSRPQ